MERASPFFGLKIFVMLILNHTHEMLFRFQSRFNSRAAEAGIIMDSI